jgi:ankyrin repeat protein
MSVAGAENPDMLRALIDAGAKVNARNEEGETALMLAARSGATSSVKVLITAGADLNIKDNKGHTALQLTQENDTPDIVQLLQAYGAQD